MINISNKIQIPETEFEFSFARSSGPGGQNVNKVSSKAILRWNPSKSTGMTTPVLLRFLANFGNRLTKEGDLIITSEKHRDQIRNQEDCINKLRMMLLTVLDPPKPRIKTKIGYFKKVKSVEQKRTHGEKKRLRQKPNFND